MDLKFARVEIGPYSLARVEITPKVLVNQITFISICNDDDDDNNNDVDK